MAKTKQSFEETLPKKNRNFLKFCYLMFVLVVVSCKSETTSKKAIDNKTEVQKETNIIAEDKKVILFFGDSLTAGYGLEDENDAFPGVIQAKIDSIGLNYLVVNSGVSGETTSGGRSRIDWILKQDIAVFVLELGANDGLRGIPLTETKENLQAIIDAVRKKNADIPIVLTGMQLPPNMGKEYTTQFSQLYVKLAQENNLVLVPFLLKDVGGIAELNQEDGIHPTVEGHQILAENVWPYVKGVITP